MADSTITDLLPAASLAGTEPVPIDQAGSTVRATVQAIADLALGGVAAGYQPLDADLTAIAALAPVNNNIMQRKAGVWVGSLPSVVKTDLALTKSDVGLSNVDNTADSSKPVSSAQAIAIGVVQTDVDAHKARVDNPHSTTKTQVGLSNADNTSDASKPVSTAQAAAIAVVQSDIDGHQALTTNPHSVTKAQVGLGSADNTSDLSKPISTATQTALNLKADLASPTFTGVPAAPTATGGTNTTQLATTAFVTAAVTGGSIADGNKGDITVSGSGSTWTVNSGAVAVAEVSGLTAALDAKAATVHTHAIADVTGLQDTLNAKAWDTDVLTVQANLDTHEARTDNPHTVTQTQVGLGSVDNTSDAAKPVSTATQTALDLKAPTTGAFLTDAQMRGIFKIEITDYTISTSQNDYQPDVADSSIVWNVTNTTGALNITGAAGGSDGRQLFIHATGAAGVTTLTHNDSASVAANRFWNGSVARPIALRNHDIAFYLYDGDAARWKLVSTTVPMPVSLVVAASDETTALTAGSAKMTFRMPYALNLTGVRASLSTAQTSGSTLTVDINEGGTSILSTKLTIDNTEKTSTTAAAAAVISDTAIADDAEITVDIDTIGDGTAKGLKVTLIGVQA